MKSLYLLLFLCLLIFSCRNSSSYGFYGESFDTTKAMTVPDLLYKMQGQSTAAAVVSGKISSSCQDDGCWLELQNDEGSPIHVAWDEKFHLPTDIAGKKAIMNGYAFIDSTDKGIAVGFKATGVKL
jgi:hypothetical protein